MLEGFGGRELTTLLQLVEHLGQNQGIVVDDGIGHQPGALPHRWSRACPSSRYPTHLGEIGRLMEGDRALTAIAF